MTPAERDETILGLEGLVKYLAYRKWRKGIPRTVEFPDLTQEAWKGAIYAVDRFRPDGGAKLSTFAARCIEYAMLDYLRAFGGMTLRQRQAVRKGLAEPPIFCTLEAVRPMAYPEHFEEQVSAACDVERLSAGLTPFRSQMVREMVGADLQLGKAAQKVGCGYWVAQQRFQGAVKAMRKAAGL